MPTSQRGRRASWASRPSLSVSSSGSCSASCCCRTLLSAYENAATTAHAAATPRRLIEMSTPIGPVTTLLPGRRADVEFDDQAIRPVERLSVGAVIGRGLRPDFGALKVGERADAEAPVALGVAAHEIGAIAVVARAAVVLRLRCVARDQHAPGAVGIVRLAVVRREPVDQDRAAG